MQTFGIHANLNKSEVRETLPQLFSWLISHNVRVLVGKNLKDISGSQDSDVQVVSDLDLYKTSDILLVLGGDGTMLSAAREVGEHETPLFGVNLGRLGFLASVSPDALYNRLQLVIDGQYQIDQRIVLRIDVSNSDTNNTCYALNDLIIDRGGISRLIQMHVEVDGEFFNDYDADGIIVATPTGSTAYSLSAGGPIVFPTSDSVLLNPVCPHSLSARPMLLPSTSQISIQAPSPGSAVSISIDGQATTQITPETRVSVQKAHHVVKIITFSDQSFFDVLRKKLHWGARPRS